MFGFEPHHIATMLRFVLENTYVEFEGEYFVQVSGIGTGNHSSGAYAEIIADNTYSQARARTGLSPSLLTTYVDDAWSIWTHGLDS